MIKNFLFHRVNPVRDKLWDPMDVKLFDKCIHFIKNHYEIVQIEDFYHLDLNSKLNRYATISFDDGYKDNIEFAAPILEKYNVKASFYVVTDCIDKNIPTWTHELKHRFLYTKKNQINLNFDFLPNEFQKTYFSSQTERVAYVLKLKPILLKISYEQKILILDEVRKSFNDMDLPEIMMSWDDLKQLQSQGHKIGSHTVTHAMLGTTKNQETINFELKESFNKITKILGKEPETIAYPVGSYNHLVKINAKNIGYKYGLAVTQNIHKPNEHDMFEIPRIELYNESWLKTRLRINNSLEIIKALIGYR